MVGEKVMPQRFTLFAKQSVLTGAAMVFSLLAAASQTPTASDVSTAEASHYPVHAKPILAAVESSGTPLSAKSAERDLVAKAPNALANPLWTISLEMLNATRERPIFSATRRPTPVLAAGNQIVASPVVSRPTLVLVGVIAGEKEGVAIFLDEATKNMIRLKTGDSHLGWTLQSVEGREATLYKEAKTAVLVLPAPRAE
jgi:hypothetical protein